MGAPNRNDPIALIMTAVPVTASPQQSLADVHKLLQEGKVHHVPVVEDGRFVGILSLNDLWRVSIGDPYTKDQTRVDAVLATKTVRSVMAEDVATIQKSDTIHRAAELLRDGGYHSLPVLEGESLVGIVTTTDLVEYLLSLY